MCCFLVDRKATLIARTECCGTLKSHWVSRARHFHHLQFSFSEDLMKTVTVMAAAKRGTSDRVPQIPHDSSASPYKYFDWLCGGCLLVREAGSCTLSALCSELRLLGRNVAKVTCVPT